MANRPKGMEEFSKFMCRQAALYSAMVCERYGLPDPETYSRPYCEMAISQHPMSFNKMDFNAECGVTYSKIYFERHSFAVEGKTILFWAIKEFA